MKILFLSDLHLDTNSLNTGLDFLSILNIHIQKHSPNIVIISGDIANDYRDVKKVLDFLSNQNPNTTFYFTYGNHDIASHNDSLHAIKELNKLPYSIHNKAVHLNEKTVLIGWSGWYDYSYKKEYHFLSQVIRTKKKDWFDGKYIFLNEDDISYYNKQLTTLNSLLETHKEKDVILSTHFIPYTDFVTFNDNGTSWDLCNSFMGSSNTGALIDKYPNVKYLSFGHTHKRYGLIPDYKNKNIICNPLGNHDEFKNISINEEHRLYLTEENLLRELDDISIFITL